MSTRARLTLVLLLLVTVSIFSRWLGGSHGPSGLVPNFAITMVVLFIALVKVRVIMREFMEMGIAPTWVRRTSDAWLAGVFTALLAVYWSQQL